MELDPDDYMKIKKTYIYANSQILAQHDGDFEDGIYFYLHDRLGSVRQVIDTSAGVKRLYTYSPFGELLEYGGNLNNQFKFTGQWSDYGFGDYYLRARQYSPYLGRFTTRDLIWGDYKQPLSLHKYLYCQNEPVNRIDPLGLFYTDINLTYTHIGLVPSIGGSMISNGPWGILSGAAVGGLGGTGGLITDFGSSKVHFYGGPSWSSRAFRGTDISFSTCLSDATTGWHLGFSWNIRKGYGQVGTTLFRDENIGFVEGGVSFTGRLLGASASLFYVFPGIPIPGIGGMGSTLADPHDITPKYLKDQRTAIQNAWDSLPLLDRAIMMSEMIQDTGQAISERQAGLMFWTAGVTVARQYGM